jgi:hypothetical protein
MWASSDGINVDRISASYCFAVYEFEAPVTGTYRVQAWGNDDPMFGIYVGAYQGNLGGHNTNSGDWTGYAKVWYEYFNDDDHYDAYDIHLDKGQKYTVRLACRNDDGGSAYIGLDVSLNGAQSPDDAWNYGLTEATHFIAPDPAVAWALPSDGNSNKVAAVRKSVELGVVLKAVTGAPDSIDGVYARGNIQIPTLAAIYRRPLYKSYSDADHGGWDIEHRSASYAGSPNLVGVTDGTQKFGKHRDYYVYASQDIYDVPAINEFDVTGDAQIYSGRAVSPYRFLTDDAVWDVNGYTGPNMTSSNGGGGVVRLSGNPSCPHDLFHNGRFVAERRAQSLILILSRPAI